MKNKYWLIALLVITPLLVAQSARVHTNNLMVAQKPWIDVTSPTYGAIPDDGEDDEAAFAAAIAYAESLNTDGTYHEKSARIVYAPAGVYNFTSLATGDLAWDEDSITLMGAEGGGTVLLDSTNSAHVFIQIGHTDYSVFTRFPSFVNIAFVADSTIADRIDTTAIEAFGCWFGDLTNVRMVNWNIEVDAHKWAGNSIWNYKSFQDDRTVKADYAFRLRGVPTGMTLPAGSTSGSQRWAGMEFLGSTQTADSIRQAIFYIESVDGLYMTTGHAYKADHIFWFNPTGLTADSNNVNAVLVSNFYCDEPGDIPIYVTGQTVQASTIGGTYGGVYSNIHFVNSKFKGSSSGSVDADHLVKVSVDSSFQKFRDIQFSNCEFILANDTAIVVEGAAQGKYDIQNFKVSDSAFWANNGEDTATTSALTFVGESVSFQNNSVENDTNATEDVVNINLAASTDSAIVIGNDFNQNNYTNDDPITLTRVSGAAATIGPNVLSGTEYIKIDNKNFSAFAVNYNTELTLDIDGVIEPSDPGYYTVDTFEGAASDDLETITTDSDNTKIQWMYVRIANQARPVTVKHLADNIYTQDGADWEMTSSADLLVLFSVTGNHWFEAFRFDQ